MFLRPSYCIVVMLSALWLGGCADTVTDGRPLKRFTDLVRDSTLTESEKKAAINELQKDKKRQQEQLDQGDGGPKTN
ncbi:MAG: hypothetical protein ACRECX_09215 [Methyloceanibacter sp.]|uniref:hypothetical protein n=1 Tax=Methyloceanibacter sp. TaxID=1965321 RepID=UPI003D6D1650